MRIHPFVSALALTAALGLPLPARAQSPEASTAHNEALVAFNARDYARARTFARQACDGGVAQSCALLGMLMESGQGGPADPGGALPYFRRACDGGVPTACAYLESRGLSAAPPEPPASAQPAAPARARTPVRDLGAVGLYGGALQLQGADVQGDDALSMGWEAGLAALQSVSGTSLVWGWGIGYHQTPFFRYEGGSRQEVVSKGLNNHFTLGLRLPLGGSADLILSGGAFVGMVESYAIDGEDTLEEIPVLGHMGGLAGATLRLGNLVVFGRYQHDMNPLLTAEYDGEFKRTGFQAGVALMRVF